MSDIDKIISDTEKYLKTIDKYHTKKLYINGTCLKEKAPDINIEIVADSNLKSRKEMVKNYEQLYWNLITKDYTF